MVRYYETLTGDEVYFSSVIILAAGNDGKCELIPGEHVYNFQFALPPNLPSSFESKLGFVRYTVKGIIDRPWKIDHETIAAFTVVSLHDLNTDPRASEPVGKEKTKKICSLCRVSPPLTVEFYIPVRGFVPGQFIPIKVNIKNESDIKIYDVILRLVKRTCENIKDKLGDMYAWPKNGPHFACQHA